MPRFQFLKILDESILPGVVTVAAKLLGLFLANFYLSSPVKIDLVGLFFINLQSSSSETTFINSLSASFMMLAIVIGFGWVIIKAHHFHDSHIHPVTAAKLAKRGWAHLIQDSYEIYHQALVWFSLLWFNVIAIGVETALGTVYVWVSVSSILTALIFTYLLWEDVKKELAET